MVAAGLVRELWRRVETINAVTYFAAECRSAMNDLGMKGFWMGYFAARAAPMGAVSAGVVHATFHNFHPTRVRRAIPDAWSIATPRSVVDARSAAAASAIRRIVPGPELAATVSGALAELEDINELHPGDGLPLFAANLEVDRPADDVARLWQASTTFREHRGDIHVALLTAAGLDGCAAHVLFSASNEVSPDLYLDSRGWSRDEWESASVRLRRRGLIDETGALSDEGGELRRQVETSTDRLAGRVLEGVDVPRLISRLAPTADAIADSGTIPFPNPMGLPATGDGR